MEIYNSKFKTTKLIENQSIMINIWTSQFMSDKDFKVEMQSWVDLIEKYDCKLLLADTRELNYTVAPDIQEWVNENIFKRIIKNKVKRLAIVESPELITQLSIEQTLDEEKTRSFQRQYFSEYNSAVEWLKSD